MILYNVTINIDNDVESEWLEWMKSTHIPAVLKTGQFLGYNMYRLLGEEKNDSVTYSIQYFAKSIREVDIYLQKYAPTLRNQLMEKYKDKHVAFRTVLESID